MSKKFNYFILGFLVGGILGCIILDIIISKYPTALDVYRGNTTLRVTVENNIPVDSTVIFRYEDEEENK